MERRDFLKLTAAATVTLAVEPAWAQTAKTEIHWLGQATTKVTTSSGKVIMIDPFLTNNPKTPPDFKNLDKLGKVDVILITHGHADHVGTVGRTDGSSDAVGHRRAGHSLRQGRHRHAARPADQDYPSAGRAFVGDHARRPRDQEDAYGSSASTTNRTSC
jgi:glyoxylase-like metal-dependent hydrolase (beta-lactamase superfamily II)